MRIAHEQHGEVAVLVPRGPIIGAEADRLRRQITKSIEENSAPLVLDISNVPFLDSQGLEVLVDATEQLIRTGRALKLTGANELIQEVLELTEVSALFEQFNDVEAAVGSL